MASRFGNWIRWQRVPVAELGIRRWPAQLFGATALTNDAYPT